MNEVTVEAAKAASAGGKPFDGYGFRIGLVLELCTPDIEQLMSARVGRIVWSAAVEESDISLEVREDGSNLSVPYREEEAVAEFRRQAIDLVGRAGLALACMRARKASTPEEALSAFGAAWEAVGEDLLASTPKPSVH